MKMKMTMTTMMKWTMRKTLRWAVQCGWQSEAQSALPSVAPAIAIETEAAASVKCLTPILDSAGIAIVVTAVATATAKTTGNSKNATHDAGLALARERSHTRR